MLVPSSQNGNSTPDELSMFSIAKDLLISLCTTQIIIRYTINNIHCCIVSQRAYRVPEGILSLAHSAESSTEQLISLATEHSPRWLGATMTFTLLATERYYNTTLTLNTQQAHSQL